jgi:CIC family chloride channel protein
MKDRLVRAWAWWMDRNRAMLPAIFADAAPLDLRLVGCTLLQAAAVGIACGFAGAAFFGILEYTQRLMLEDLPATSCCAPAARPSPPVPGRACSGPGCWCWYRPWGAWPCGWLTRREPDARGGGGDVMIRAFHHGAALHPRLLGTKLLARSARWGGVVPAAARARRC